MLSDVFRTIIYAFGYWLSVVIVGSFWTAMDLKKNRRSKHFKLI